MDVINKFQTNNEIVNIINTLNQKNETQAE